MTKWYRLPQSLSFSSYRIASKYTAHDIYSEHPNTFFLYGTIKLAERIGRKMPVLLWRNIECVTDAPVLISDISPQLDLYRCKWRQNSESYCRQGDDEASKEVEPTVKVAGNNCRHFDIGCQCHNCHSCKSAVCRDLWVEHMLSPASFCLIRSNSTLPRFCDVPTQKQERTRQKVTMSIKLICKATASDLQHSCTNISLLHSIMHRPCAVKSIKHLSTLKTLLALKIKTAIGIGVAYQKEWRRSEAACNTHTHGWRAAQLKINNLSSWRQRCKDLLLPSLWLG